MHKYWTGIAGLCTLLLGVLLLSLFPSTGHRAHPKPIRVVTSLNFYGEVASQVAGKYGQVTSIINSASVDPHDYQPSTRQARAINYANLVVQNGLGYDQWLSKLVQGNGKGRLTTIDVGRQVANKKAGDNEHIWYRPETIKKLTVKLAAAYGRIDPAHAQYYRRRAQLYLKSLRPLDKQIAAVKERSGSRREVAVTEPVFNYALANLGYRIIDQHFAKSIEDGNDPSPKDISHLQSAIKHHRIAFLVENSQTDDQVVSNMVKLARRHHVPVLKVTEAKPNGLTYRQWMMKQYRDLAKIQQRED